MKKSTNPLALDFRAGGFEVLPISKMFVLPSNVWYPSNLIRENLLPEPLAAWSANVFWMLNCVKVEQFGDEGFFYMPTDSLVRPYHFAQRLSSAKVQAIIDRVIGNAENVNADPSRDFIVESLGIFGSVLDPRASLPGDVDIVFTARWRSNGKALPEASYYPFGSGEPTHRVSSALGRGSRRTDLSTHYILEVERIGAPYRTIWTRREGRVDREMVTPKTQVSDKHVLSDEDELSRVDAFADSFRSRCELLPPQPEPAIPLLQEPTRPMSRAGWLTILDENHPVVELAHSLCLPPGELKQKVSAMVTERFKTRPRLEAEAQKKLRSYLAASTLYADWEWESNNRPSQNQT